MRQIEFRGKSSRNIMGKQEWIYGDLQTMLNPKTGELEYWIGRPSHPSNVARQELVSPETIGQFSSFITDDGDKIYEGDVVNYLTGNPSRYVSCVVRFGDYDIWEEGDCEQHTGFYLEGDCEQIPLRSLWIKKIGNIHDNPELIPKHAQQ